MFSQNSVSALATELDKLSRIMGNKDVRTTFQGTGAFTNGTTINVPAMDMTAELDPTHQAIMRGYHIHEVSHVTDTDFGVFKKRGIKKIKDIWNCAEDVFIERKAMEKYAGARKNLQQTINHVLGNENEFRRANPDDPQCNRERWWKEIPYAALQQARKDMGYESEELDEYVKGLPKELAREARKFAKRMVASESSGDALKVARSMKRRMDKLGTPEQEEEQEQETQPQKGQGDDTEDGEGQANGENDGDDGDEEGGTKGDGGDDDGGNDEGEGEDDGFDIGAAQQRADDAMSDVFGKYNSGNSRVCENLSLVFDTHDELWRYYHKIINAEYNTKNSRRLVNDNYLTPSNRTRMDVDKDLTTQCRESMADDVRQYSARLARLLLAQEDRRNEGGYSSGRIDRRRLSQLVAGNDNVFTRPSITKTSETRLMIAVDGSSSMSEVLTIQAVLALNSCLGRAGIKYDIVEWSGLDLRNEADTFQEQTSIVYHKKASESWRKINEVFQFLPVGGGTPTYASITSVSRIMSGWTEPRRVCLFLTDGEPDAGRRGEVDMVAKHTKAMRDGGIEVYGIGISANEKIMRNMFGEHVVMTDFSRLGNTLLGGIERLLISEGHAHAA
jgi:cobalamin biosynthesis protein CobT